MKCSRCSSEDTKVLESRIASDGKSIRRRRECRRCEHRFTTYEKEEVLDLQIRKKDGHVEPYMREKALRSIQIACKKRSIKIEEIDFMLSKIESQIHELGLQIIESSKLGDHIMEALSELDPVAYVRFASVYKDFKDPREFYTFFE